MLLTLAAFTSEVCAARVVALDTRDRALVVDAEPGGALDGIHSGKGRVRSRLNVLLSG